jgi:uncharacterized RDD family membrane protein YckC
LIYVGKNGDEWILNSRDFAEWWLEFIRDLIIVAVYILSYPLRVAVRASPLPLGFIVGFLILVAVSLVFAAFTSVFDIEAGRGLRLM